MSILWLALLCGCAVHAFHEIPNPEYCSSADPNLSFRPTEESRGYCESRIGCTQETYPCGCVDEGGAKRPTGYILFDDTHGYPHCVCYEHYSGAFGVTFVESTGEYTQHQGVDYHCHPGGSRNVICNGKGEIHAAINHQQTYDSQWDGQLCLCDSQWIGRINPSTLTSNVPWQCTQLIRNVRCHGHGNEKTNAQHDSTVDPATLDCTCDIGWKNNPSNSNSKCDTLKECKDPLPAPGFDQCGQSINHGACVYSGSSPNDLKSCHCNSGYGGTYCCPIVAGSVCNINHGAGTCTKGDGTCTCASGRGGPFCCPIAHGQTIACGGTHGTCSLSTGNCVCDAFGRGVACNITCPNVGGQPCGGTNRGSCDSKGKCVCDTLHDYGGTYCCPIWPIANTNPVQKAVCGNRGTCGSDGNCACNTGRSGLYCCPKMDWQAASCGAVAGHGTCGSNGVCTCNAGYGGIACELDISCNSQDTTHECSDGGTCTHWTSIDQCLDRLHFDDDVHQSITLNDGTLADEGMVALVRLLANTVGSFGWDDATIFQHVATYTPFGGNTPCTGTSTRIACLTKIIDRFLTNVNWFNVTAGIDSQGNWAGNILAAMHPWVGTISAGYASTVGALVYQPGANQQKQRRIEAIIAMLCYPVFSRITFPAQGEYQVTATYPTFPMSTCECDAAASDAVIGQTYVLGNTLCQNECLVGSNLETCSGIFQGEFRGSCVGENECFCNSRYSGDACQDSLVGQCYPGVSFNEFACTAPDHGMCLPPSPPGQPLYHCGCQATWIGQFCEFSICQPGGASDADRRIECNRQGTCQSNGNCVCDVQASLQLAGSDDVHPPVLPVGQFCQDDAVAQCGVFYDPTPHVPGDGEWQECNNRGTCVRNQADTDYVCSCEEGYSGALCDQSTCTPVCNSHARCDNSTGTCFCQEMWGSPGGCVDTTQPCFCSVNLCGLHGFPTLHGDECTCAEFFAKDNQGHCTVVQCPLVFISNQQERACHEGIDLVCNGTLTTNCCADVCSQCVYNSTAQSVKCICDDVRAFDEEDGICFSKCFGQPYHFQGQTLVCDCDPDLVADPVHQFVSQFCELFECEHDTHVQGLGCNCAGTPWTGTTCGQPACGDRGTLNGTLNCICHEPFFHSPPTSPLCLGDHCAGSPLIETQFAGIKCDCAANQLIGPNALSCETLTCTGHQTAACALCVHGTPVIHHHNITCDCTSSGFTGLHCQNIVCSHSGTPFTNNTGCHCPFPWSGTRCLQDVCIHGDVDNTGTGCLCDSGWEGLRCDTATPIVEESSSTAESSSSSSTGEESSTAESSSGSGESSGGIETSAAESHDWNAFVLFCLVATLVLLLG